jgi:hypothetical protein
VEYEIAFQEVQKNTATYLDTNIEEIPPLDVLSKSLVQIEYVIQRVSRCRNLIHARLDVLARLRVESRAPAFE